MKERNAVRGLVLDSQNRVLLMQIKFKGRDKMWVAPGGGIEEGEKKEEAIARELREELGPIAIEIGPQIWFGAADVPLYDDELIRLRETYFLCRTHDTNFTRDGWTELEHEVVLDLRWWTLDEIRASDEIIYPTSLATELPPVLNGPVPLYEIEI